MNNQVGKALPWHQRLNMVAKPPVRSHSFSILSAPKIALTEDTWHSQGGFDSDESASKGLYSDVMEIGQFFGTLEGISFLKRVLKRITPKYLDPNEQAMLASVQSILTEHALRLDNQGEINQDKPMGSLAYHSILRREGIDMSCNALQKLLDREVQLLESKVKEAAKRIDPSRHWQEIARDMSQDHPQSKEEVLAAYRAEIDRAKRFLGKNALIELPKQDAAVVQTPPGAPRDIPFSICPATYYHPLRQMEINWSDKEGHKASVLAAHFKARIPIIAVHEVYPGHYTAMMASAPKEQRRLEKEVGDLSFFGEGWASYAEKLMLEQGFFQKPEERFFVLVQHLKLANRARKSLLLHSGTDLLDMPENVKAQHIQDGSNLASYYLGMLQIERLRKLVMDTYPKMTLGEFHNRLIHVPEMPFPQMAKVAFGINFPALAGEESMRGVGAASYKVGSAVTDGNGPFANTEHKRLQAFSRP